MMLVTTSVLLSDQQIPATIQRVMIRMIVICYWFEITADNLEMLFLFY